MRENNLLNSRSFLHAIMSKVGRYFHILKYDFYKFYFILKKLSLVSTSIFYILFSSYENHSKVGILKQICYS